jgi:magnesium transporter
MLVNCVAYQEGTKLKDISKEEISDYVKRRETFVWVALKDPTPEELEEMREAFDLHELALEDARHGHQRPKIEEYADSLFAVKQTIEFRDDELHVGEVDIFVGPNYILSVRLNTERGFSDVRARCER